MGCFSWDCKACGHSVRASHATNKTSTWLSEAVMVEPDGNAFRGTYDGYGSLKSRGGRELDMSEGDGAPCLYHQACFDLLGKPAHSGPSRSARDQGHFVGEYDPKKPASREEIEALAKHANDAAEADRKVRAESLKNMQAELVAKGEPIPDWLKWRVEDFEAGRV